MYFQNSHLSPDLTIDCKDCDEEFSMEEDFSMEEVQEFSSQYHEQELRYSSKVIAQILENAQIHYQEMLAAMAEMDRKNKESAMDALIQQMASTSIGMNVHANAFVPMAMIPVAPVRVPTEFSRYLADCKIQIAKFTKEGINGKNYKKYYYFNQLFIIHDEENQFSRYLNSPKRFMEKMNGEFRARIRHCDVFSYDPFGQVKTEDVIDLEDFQYYLENPEDEFTRSSRLIVSFEKTFQFAFYLRPFSVDNTWYGFEIRIKTPDNRIHFFQGKWRF